MAYLNLEYYSNTDSYSDGNIENDIFDIVKGRKNASDYKNDYAVTYHLSPVRENIVNWYPFNERGSCLEIGAGCGAITGVLCRKLNKVVSVDISKRRSEINFERHNKYNNLEIIVGNVHEISFAEKFDYIVLNGVFEYALSFTHTKDNAYVEFLSFIATLLKDKGHIIIAIENRLGLKYFNGAAEDHTDEYFLGLNNYVNNNSVRTFSKKEISDIIENCGFYNYKFYYPYPDYKFPNEIFSDESINTSKYGRPYFNFNRKNLTLFNEQKVSNALAAENVLSVFSNSFLIEISKGNLSNIVYAKINTDRKDKYKIATIISGNENLIVEKIPLNDEAKEHINNIYKNSGISFTEFIKPLEVSKTSRGIAYDFCNLKTLDDIVGMQIQRGNYDSVEEIISRLFKSLVEKSEYKDYYTDEFKNIFGCTKVECKLKCINPANIDLILDNVMVNDDKYVVIDTEWVFSIDVPVLFILWRTIRELYTKHNKISEAIPYESMLSRFDIDTSMNKVFEAWALNFVNNYVADDNFELTACYRKNIELAESYYLIFNDSRTSLYIDDGNGYNEETKLFSDLNVADDGNFTLRFELPENVVKLRWDPVEIRCCKCRVDFINGYIESSNADYRDAEGFDVFNNIDPQYSIVPKEKTIVIKGKIFIEHIVASATTYSEKMNIYKGELNYKNEIIDDLNNKNNSLSGKLSNITLENERLNLRLVESGKSQEYLVEQIVNLRSQIKKQEIKYDEIINSKGWKILDFLRKFTICFRR